MLTTFDNPYDPVSVPCRGIISYSDTIGPVAGFHWARFRPLSGDYLLFMRRQTYITKLKDEFPSPVGGLSLIQKNLFSNGRVPLHVSVPCRGIISYSLSISD